MKFLLILPVLNFSPSWGTYNICFSLLSAIAHILLCMTGVRTMYVLNSSWMKAPWGAVQILTLLPFHIINSYSFIRYQLQYNSSKEDSSVLTLSLCFRSVFPFQRLSSQMAALGGGAEGGRLVWGRGWRCWCLFTRHYFRSAWHRASYLISDQ